MGRFIAVVVSIALFGVMVWYGFVFLVIIAFGQALREVPDEIRHERYEKMWQEEMRQKKHRPPAKSKQGEWSRNHLKKPSHSKSCA